MITAKDVDKYIAKAPSQVQGKLKELRAIIKASVPSAQERISYGIPFYHYKGRLIYFAIAKKHIGLYAITAPVLNKYISDLKGYVMSKGTIRLPLSEELPITLIKKLVKAQAKENDKHVDRS